MNRYSNMFKFLESLLFTLMIGFSGGIIDQRLSRFQAESPEMNMPENNTDVGVQPDRDVPRRFVLNRMTNSDIVIASYKNGLAQLEAGNTDSAIYYLKEVVQWDPFLIEAKIKLSSAYLESGNYRRAGILIKAVLERDSSQAEAYLILGQIMQFQGRFVKAISAYRKCIELENNNPNALNRLAVLSMKQGDFRTAVQLLQRAIEQKRDEPEFYNNLGLAYERLERYEKARGFFSRALKIDPTNSQARKHIFQITERLSD